MDRPLSCRRFGTTSLIKFRITTLVCVQYSPNNVNESDANADMRRKQVCRVMELERSLGLMLELKAGCW